jgi:hypothetical protein
MSEGETPSGEIEFEGETNSEPRDLEGRVEDAEAEQENARYSNEYSNEKNLHYKTACKPESQKEDTPSELEQKAQEPEISELAEALSKELSKEEAEELVRELSNERKETKHNWVDIDTWLNRIKSYKGKSLGGGIKGLVYLISALADTGPAERDPYKDIDNGASVIYVPGYLSIPRSIDSFEKHSGLKVAYVSTTDIDELSKVIEYANKKHGEAVVIGFSDGGKVIENYIKKYGDSNVKRFYAIASNPIKSSKRVTHIIGDRDMLAAMEKEYNYKGVSNVRVINGGHTFMFYDPLTIKQISNIIISQTPSAYYTPLISHAHNHNNLTANNLRV